MIKSLLYQVPHGNQENSFLSGSGRCIGLVVFLISLCFTLSCNAFNNSTRIAFYYGDNPPADELHAFNVVVVNAESHIKPREFNDSLSKLYAYISVGEVDKSAPYVKQINASWIRGANAAWDSHVMDLANPAWREFLLANRVDTLWRQGYRGFFLDTLDSYELLKLPADQRKQQEAGIVDFIKKIKKKHPEAEIIINRGFPIVDEIHQDIVAIAAESLFAGWDTSKKVYAPVSDSERNSLLTVLSSIQNKYKLPIIIIDYVSPTQRQLSRDVAKQIAALGFIPWVSVPELDILGVGLVEVVPRKVLLLYDTSTSSTSQVPATRSIYEATAFILQYMGYVPILHQVDKDLPNNNLNGIYAGIITWFNQEVVKNPGVLEAWLTKQVNNHVPLLFLENFGLENNSPLLKRLGISKSTLTEQPRSVHVLHKDPSLGYEIFPKPIELNFIPTTVEPAQILLSLADEKKTENDVIGITSWGGFALQGYNIVNLPGGEGRWVFNPIPFFKQALKLSDFPTPDITTENGRRILTVHIDGDAFISRVPWRKNTYAGEMIFNEIIKKYQIPTSVSVIQREFEIIAKFPAVAKRLVNTAKEMFALPWVEIATHTYSHPLTWKALEEGKLNEKALSYPDPSYKFSYEKEIIGSQTFINEKLAPPNKKVVAIFWTGDADILEKPLKMAYAAGLKNINGMSKIYTNKNPSISNLGAFGNYLAQYYQIFAPIPNEFEYTHDWQKPWFTFDQAIHTFELTEKPVRYKPISIYYHFYSAVEQASLVAIIRVYEWAMQQYVTPLFISDYIDHVLDFNKTVIAKDSQVENRWLITQNGTLREFRWLKTKDNPELATSSNIAGFNIANNDYYIHLGPAALTWISFSTNPQNQPYLYDANAKLTQWIKLSEHEIQFTLNAYVSLQFKLANMEQCQLMMNKQLVQANSENTYILPGVNNATFTIHCA